MPKVHLLPIEADENALPSETQVSRMMDCTLGMGDMTLTYVMAIFLLTNAVVSVANGAVALLYLGLGILIFFLPCVVATMQLGSMYPLEGSLYPWTYKALGSFWSFFVSLCYWIAGVLAVLISGNAFVTTLQGLHTDWLPEPWQQGIVILIIVAFSGLLGTFRMRTTQNIVNGLFLFFILQIGLVSLSAVIWIFTKHPSATNFTDIKAWSINPGNFSLFSVIALNFIGVNSPLDMAGEIKGQGKDPRLVRRIICGHLFWGTLIIIIFYTLVSVSMLIVRGSAAMLAAPSLPFEGFTAVEIVLGPFWMKLAALSFLASSIFGMTFYTYTFARILLAAGLDKRIPLWFGQLNRQRVPAHAVCFHTSAVAAVTIIIYIIAPALASFGGNAAKALEDIYTVVSAAATLIWTIATIFLFIDIAFLYLRDPFIFKQQRIFPIPIIWVCVIIGTLACLLIIIGTLLYSWIPESIPNSTWCYLVGIFTLGCTILAGILSLYANSQANWEGLSAK